MGPLRVIPYKKKISKIPAIFVQTSQSENKGSVSGSDRFYTFNSRVTLTKKNLIILINFKNSHNYENDSLVWT